MGSIAIIGAGVSGLAAAHTLQDAGQEVTVFEKSHSPGGRATTRKRAGFIYDHGAQYIKPGHTLSSAWITERFASPDLIDIARPVWIFDHAGQIQPGDPAQNVGPKWSYQKGLCTLPKLMAKQLNIRLGTQVVRLEFKSAGWELFDDEETSLGSYERVLVAIPTPQASDLLERSTFDPALQTRSMDLLQQASYRPLLSVMLGYRPTPRTRPYYALVNPDKQHPISWLAWEHAKTPVRTPAGTGLLLAQMAPDYSHEHRETPPAEIYQDLHRRLVELLEEELAQPIFSDLQHWRYALPDKQANAAELNTLTGSSGLFFCGDGFVGGRVALALEHGIEVALKML